MSRTSRVPYHQNVYDLLQLEPGESPEAARMIAEHKAQYGPLPASVREWYLVPNVVPLSISEDQWRIEVAADTIWFEYSNAEQVLSLAEILRGFARRHEQLRGRFVTILIENQGTVSWWAELNGSDNPPVWVDNDQPDESELWTQESQSFSDFVSHWIATFYQEPFTPVTRNHFDAFDAPASGAKPFVKPHHSGLWLRTPDEPFQPPVIDFLIDQFGEPDRAPRPGAVTTYTFRPAGGTIRVTADEPALMGGLSAWWVHADTPERLAEFATLLLPWGTLRETLRADTDAAREVLRCAHSA